MMEKAALVLIDGFEEIEAITIIDVLRRGEVDMTTLSLNKDESKIVHGKHGVDIYADQMWKADQTEMFDRLIIPGGTIAYLEHDGLLEWVKQMAESGKKLAAICAAPAVLGKAGVLEGKKATIFPGMEAYIGGADIQPDLVVQDDGFLTGKGPAASMAFSLALLREIRGEETATRVAKAMLAEK